MARALAILGSASDVGKSVIAAGLCRLLADAGVKVAPYKAQNMANQAGVTGDGLEMSRAQLVQARACRVEPHVDMAPVLLKPVTATRAEVVLLGRAIGQRYEVVAMSVVMLRRSRCGSSPSGAGDLPRAHVQAAEHVRQRDPEHERFEPLLVVASRRLVPRSAGGRSEESRRARSPGWTWSAIPEKLRAVAVAAP